MSERAVRLLVLAALVPLAIAGIAANVVLGHGSGTYYGFVIYLVIVGAFAGLVWREPRPRWLLVWSGVGWVATIVHQTIGDPYAREVAHPYWPVVSTPLWIGVVIMVFAAPIAAVARSTPDDPDQMLFAVRARRVAKLAALAALVAVLVIPFSQRGWDFSVLIVMAYAALVLLPGIRVYRAPDRRAVWLWTVWASPLAALGAMVGHDMHLPLSLKIAFACFGTMFALLVVILPLVAILTRDRDAVRLPPARVR